MRRIATIIGAVLLSCLLGCGYVAGNYPPTDDPTAVPDSNKVITVNGKQYRCVNRDGTWRCQAIGEALAKARKDLSDPRHLDASSR